MIGMPTYGRSFTLIDPTKFDIGAPASGGGTPGKYTGEAGFMSYYEVCTVYYLNFLMHSNKVLDRLSGISFSNSEKQENQLIAVFCV
jgi:hypothetical protein